MLTQNYSLEGRNYKLTKWPAFMAGYETGKDMTGKEGREGKLEIVILFFYVGPPEEDIFFMAPSMVYISVIKTALWGTWSPGWGSILAKRGVHVPLS